MSDESAGRARRAPPVATGFRPIRSTVAPSMVPRVIGLCMVAACTAAASGEPGDTASRAYDPPAADENGAVDDVEAGKGTTARCAYDPSSGEPNPLGTRAFVSVHREGEDSVFVYEKLPALVGDGSERASLAVRRTLTVQDMTITEARAWLRTREALFDELLGYESVEGYAAVDAVLVCR